VAIFANDRDIGLSTLSKSLTRWLLSLLALNLMIYLMRLMFHAVPALGRHIACTMRHGRRPYAGKGQAGAVEGVEDVARTSA
jgi:hypothetical protein